MHKSRRAGGLSVDGPASASLCVRVHPRPHALTTEVDLTAWAASPLGRCTAALLALAP
jgi:hypothetical protein